MSIRFAFAGFRHGHINDLYRLAGERVVSEVVGACEEHQRDPRGHGKGGDQGVGNSKAARGPAMGW